MADADWFKSSYSNDQGGACVEGARLGNGLMAIRDSKRQPDGPVFVVRAAAWSAFVGGLKRRTLG
ncbi:DUF397 domain-containing protein [Streptomyces sp. 891-h]|uniref:DUF397 domain-containing protein n=1 Tax=Streptomyces sp. 891-h TaxID=2720714 RepID=UPI001FAB0D66|nr:DUF397 domain-containing protein [Streptomyces sp. 891-h]UNZ18086.1 DUF397 domain-containing protein [Streptomyces sp. 891-h]